MTLNTDELAVLTLYGKQVPSCEKFKYLGTFFNVQSSGAQEFETRLNLGYQRLASLQPVFRRKDLLTSLKVRVVQSMVFPVVTYGCEAWTLCNDEWAKLRAFETKCLRRVMGISYKEHATNEEVFRRAGARPILVSQVRRRKLTYFGHVMRHESLEKTIMIGMIPSQRKQGGQPRKWIDDICSWLSILEGRSITVPEAARMAQDREGFRALITSLPFLEDKTFAH